MVTVSGTQKRESEASYPQHFHKTDGTMSGGCPMFLEKRRGYLREKCKVREERMNNTTLSELARSKPPESILEHEIQIRAYELYEQRGRQQGHALQDWLKAEAEIMGKRMGYS
jgi:hypothetical protein